MVPTKKTFVVARIGRGKHQKACKREIWREHNSNLLQRHLHCFKTLTSDILLSYPTQYYAGSVVELVLSSLTTQWLHLLYVLPAD